MREEQMFLFLKLHIDTCWYLRSLSQQAQRCDGRSGAESLVTLVVNIRTCHAGAPKDGLDLYN